MCERAGVKVGERLRSECIERACLVGMGILRGILLV